MSQNRLKRTRMRGFAVNDKEVLHETVTDYSHGHLLIPFGSDLLCIRHNWSIKGFKMDDNGKVTQVKVRYAQNTYNHQYVDMALPLEKVWVLNHKAIINKLREDMVPRSAWFRMRPEWEFRALKEFHSVLDNVDMEYQVALGNGDITDDVDSMDGEENQVVEHFMWQQFRLV